MSSEAKTSSATAAGGGGGGGGGGGRGFRARMEHYLYSGEKKHVFAGLVIISAVFAVPWYLMNRGSYLFTSLWIYTPLFLGSSDYNYEFSFSNFPTFSWQPNTGNV
ncbi:hypothetical protein ACFX14_046889 [Malus domestica]